MVKAQAMLQRCAEGLRTHFATLANQTFPICCIVYTLLELSLKWQWGLVKPFLKWPCPGAHATHLPHC